MWGDLRQLRGYELDLSGSLPSRPSTANSRPLLSNSTASYPPSSLTPSFPFTTSDNAYYPTLVIGKETRDDDDDDDLYRIKQKMDIESQYHPEDEVVNYGTLPYHPHTRPPPGVPQVHQSQHSYSRSRDFDFDFDSLPTSQKAYSITSSTIPRSLIGSTFSPVTRVLSPLVLRAQWEILKRATLWGMVFCIGTGAICLAVPGRR